MPTSLLKRPSARGRLGRLLASLRQPSRAGGSLPVQTGFPTSLADLVVKNHGRLKNPRRRSRPSAATAPPPVAADPAPPAREQHTREAVVHRPKGFSIRPEVLGVCGAVALALLVVWSKWLVAAATVASVALFWVESVRSSPASTYRSPRLETEGLLVSSRASPIREDAGSSEGRPSSNTDSDGGKSDAGSIAPTRKEKNRRSSLRKLIAKTLRNGKKRDDKDAADTGKAPERAGVNAVVAPVEPDAPSPAPVAVDAIADERCRKACACAFPAEALVPIVLVGLVGGKLPAVALTVLCAVFFSSVDSRMRSVD